MTASRSEQIRAQCEAWDEVIAAGDTVIQYAVGLLVAPDVADTQALIEVVRDYAERRAAALEMGVTMTPDGFPEVNWCGRLHVPDGWEVR